MVLLTRSSAFLGCQHHRPVHHLHLDGDNVLLGAGCCILGEVRIGDGAKIGANAVVLQDVPAGTIAVGIPAVIKINKIKS